MMRRGKATRYIYIFLFTFCFTLQALAQYRIQGRVVDDESKEPVLGASIRVVGTLNGTSSDASGQFVISSEKDSVEIRVNLIGYETKTVFVKTGIDNIVSLDPVDNVIPMVSVQAKIKYSNKNNPAVELIDLVIQHKNQNRLSGKKCIQFDQYDKLKVGMIDPKPFFKKGFSGLNFIFENIDTTTVAGKELLTLYIEENQSKIYSQKDPSQYKKLIHHQQKTEFDPRYVNNPNIQSSLNYIFQPIDIYDESIFLLNKLFLSPISDNGKLYYKYFIVDTIVNAEGSFVKLNFVPRNTTDLLFTGSLMISMDGAYAVKKAELTVNKAANLNFVTGIKLGLDYSPNSQGVMLLDTTKTEVFFGARKSEAFYGERISIHDNYDLESEFPEGIFAGAPIELSKNATNEIPSRPINLSKFEQTTYEDIERLNENKSFRTMLAASYLLVQGYHNVGIFELGPLEYLYSKNNIEGNRFRIGGRTNTLLSDKAYVEGYLAYGDQDKELKYYLRTAFSINGKSIATFPAHYLEASIQHDIFDPGRAMGFLKGDSFFMALRRNRPTKWFGIDAYRLQHVLEFGNHVSVSTGFTHTRRETLGDFRLISSGDPNESVTHMNTNDLEVELRWAPNEKFYYRNLSRQTVIEKHPVFTLTYNKGITGFWDADYDYDKVTASVSKRFFLNQVGFADMTLTGGKIWGTLPYTLLHLPNVRQNIGRHDITYDLMNSMEFAADEFVKFGVVHQMQGFILNKIPLVKKLKLREIWGAQMFYGKMSDHNNPALSNDVVQFDTNSEGIPLTHALGKVPYWEASVGVDNILRVLRVEYVRRLTHTNFPNISKDRYRVSLSVHF